MNTTGNERGLGPVTQEQLSDFDHKLRGLIQESPLFEGELSLEQFVLRLMVTPLRLSLEVARAVPGADRELSAMGVAHLLTTALNATLVATDAAEMLHQRRAKAH